MKNIILIIFLIGFIGCKTDNRKFANEEKQTKRSIDSVFFDDKGDTIKQQIANLKSNYRLIIFPALDKKKEGVINFRLINGKKDNTYLLANTLETNHMLYYEGVDFQSYFALHASFGTHNLYFWLYDKKTGKEVFTGIGRDVDLKNELILYEDEDNDYDFFIYDVNTKIKTLIEIPSELIGKYECTKYNDFYKTIYIKYVTNKYYFIAFRNCPSSVEFRVKKGK